MGLIKHTVFNPETRQHDVLWPRTNKGAQMSNIQKIREHLVRNKTVYIVGGICLTAGAVGGAVLARRSVVSANAVQVLTYKSHQTLEVYVEALGDPGNIVRDTTTGTIYASQGQAARELGLDKSALSRHLSGQKPNVNGHVFEVLGKAHTPSTNPA